MAYGNYAPFYRGGFFNPMQTPTMPQMADNQGQYMPQYQQQPIQQPTQQNSSWNDMIWVLSEVEAQSCPGAPNNSVTLWDKNKDTVYIKSVNAQGVPSMRILDYVERTADNASKMPYKSECQCGSKFVSKEEFNALQSKLDGLQNELEALKEKPKAKSIKKSVDEVENDG